MTRKVGLWIFLAAFLLLECEWSNEIIWSFIKGVRWNTARNEWNELFGWNTFLSILHRSIVCQTASPSFLKFQCFIKFIHSELQRFSTAVLTIHNSLSHALCSYTSIPRILMHAWKPSEWPQKEGTLQIRPYLCLISYRVPLHFGFMSDRKSASLRLLFGPARIGTNRHADYHLFRANPQNGHKRRAGSNSSTLTGWWSVIDENTLGKCERMEILKKIVVNGFLAC